MSNTDKASVVDDSAAASLRALLLMGITGTSPMTGFSRSFSTMDNSSSVAAALAVLPSREDAPRVIRQFTSIFLVSRLGELWRVYDTDDPQTGERRMPSSQSTDAHRLFLALARGTQLRVHTFAPGASRDLDPVSLQTQLDASEVR